MAVPKLSQSVWRTVVRKAKLPDLRREVRSDRQKARSLMRKNPSVVVALLFVVITATSFANQGDKKDSESTETALKGGLSCRQDSCPRGFECIDGRCQGANHPRSFPFVGPLVMNTSWPTARLSATSAWMTCVQGLTTFTMASIPLRASIRSGGKTPAPRARRVAASHRTLAMAGTSSR